MDMKFDRDDPLDILSMFKIFSRSLRGHYEVTSGLIKYAPIKLKFDVNDPFNNLNI